MKISLQDAGKRFNREWIFRHLDLDFIPGTQYAITGANGSGKSTLLQVIAGASIHSEGKITYYDQRSNLINDPYRHLSIAAPYLDLVEELTALELLSFHSRFKALSQSHNYILETTGLINAADKQIRYFSSGMKQRLKLGLAFFSKTDVLLLDEPTTNLDSEGIDLYRALIRSEIADRLVIISSNDPDEYDFCSVVIKIGDYK